MRKFDDGNSYILYDSADDVCFQWEIIEIQGENLETVKKFIENCCSCIISNKIDSYIKSYLIDIGFKEYEGNLIYYPFGVVYRIDDLTDSTFYIGMCENLSRWDTGYLGSGLRWLNHINKHADHEYRRTILHNCEVPSETRRLELLEIQKYFKLVDGSWTKQNRKCMNIHVRTQGQPYTGRECEECGSFGSTHKDWCSKANICSECGGNSSHKKGCSKYKEHAPCDECGGVCGKHKKGCSKYNPPDPCKECGAKFGHKKECSRYKESKRCPECGSVWSHKKGCSKSRKCQECGGVHTHYNTCSKYKRTPCLECGSIGRHKIGCSHFHKQKICNGCGGKDGHHKSSCPKYKNRYCPECGSKGITHKRGCSKYSQPEPCLDCGGKGGKHKKGCPKYKETKICDECGSVNGKHKKGCSHFKPNKPCPDCGSTGGHRKDCPRYNQSDPCPECGTINGHVKRCSRYNKNNNVNNLEGK